jgi:parvulin-like peptidyl-prolyl isomerase
MRILVKIPLLLPVLAVVAIAAGCGSSGGGSGGGSDKLATSDVAVVGGVHITKSSFNDVMRQEELSMKSQGQKFPKPGSTQYAAVKSQVLAVLVQNAEFEQQARQLGVAPTDKDISTQLASLKKQYFGGSEKRYQQSLKKQGFTDAEVRDQIRIQLISQRLFDKITGDVKASDQEIHDYYVAHKSQYETQASRDAQYILVGKGKTALAASLLKQLTGAPDKTWCTLAKKYSQDPSSKSSCGKATFTKGQTVPEFDKLLFSLPTKKVGSVNTSKYGWFVLRPTAAAKPAGTQPEQEVSASISAQLVQQKRNQQMTDWVTKIAKSYCGGSKVTYQAGYQPVPDPCQTLTTPPATT